MGIAANMGLNPAIAAGAIISGAYFGDTCSPLSDSANLAAAASGVDLYPHLRETLLTSSVAARDLDGDLLHAGPAGGLRRLGEDRRHQGARSTSRLWLFLPLVVVVVLAAFKVTPFTSIFLGALAGGLLAAILEPGRVIAFADPGGELPRVAGAAQGRLARAGERVQVVVPASRRSTCWRRAAAWTAC